MIFRNSDAIRMIKKIKDSDLPAKAAKTAKSKPSKASATKPPKVKTAPARPADAKAADAPGEARTVLYMQVQRALMEGIEAGRYHIGSRLPTETSLCKEFQVSRHTVREALRHLRNAGFISSRQGSGYTVASVSAQHRYVQAVSSLDEFLQYVSKTRFTLIGVEMVEADTALAARLSCSVGRKWLHVRGVRRLPFNPKPVGMVEVFVNSSFAGIRKLLEAGEIPVYTLIERTYGERVEEVVQTMRAMVVPAKFAADLKVEPNSAAMEIERVFRSATGKVIEITFNCHPVNRFNYTTLLRAAS